MQLSGRRVQMERFYPVAPIAPMYVGRLSCRLEYPSNKMGALGPSTCKIFASRNSRWLGLKPSNKFKDSHLGVVATAEARPQNARVPRFLTKIVGDDVSHGIPVLLSSALHGHGFSCASSMFNPLLNILTKSSDSGSVLFGSYFSLGSDFRFL